jgi:hypothetical protein
MTLVDEARAQIVQELKEVLAHAGYSEHHRTERSITYVLADADEYSACLDEEKACVTFWHSPASYFNRRLFGPESDAKKVQEWLKFPNPI